ncbi:hypothetical protein WJX81_004659 [Elliptochloris bilobata]|uniref:Uncharacterized protein n=1 Tax=Elliptochloris bilobata TaxID=381761 RepID=A0AAW1S8Z5_9CHLO
MGCIPSKQKEQASEMIGKGLDKVEQRTGPKGDQLVEKVRGEINHVLGMDGKPEALLVGLPVVLPLLALYASRRHSQLRLEAALAEVTEGLRASEQSVTQAVVGEASAAADAVAALRAELARQLPPGQLRAIEAKLAALEGSVLSAGRSVQDAAREVDGAAARLARATSARLDGLSAELGAAVRAELAAGAGEPGAAFARVEARLAALEGGLGGLEAGQSDGLRRLARDVAAGLEDAEASLLAALRTESGRSLEQVRRLPATLAAALPVTDVTPLGAKLSAGAGEGPLVAELADAEREWLRGALAGELSAAAQRIVDAQAGALQELQERPAALAGEQWEALGQRLRLLEQGVQEVLRREEKGSTKADSAELLQALERTRADVAAALADAAAKRKGAGEDAGAVGDALQRALAPVQASLAALQTQVLEARPAADGTAAAADLAAELAAVQASLQAVASSQAELQAAVAAVVRAPPWIGDGGEAGVREVSSEGSGEGVEASSAERVASSGSAAGEAAPATYKGDPRDSPVDAYHLMQTLLREEPGRTADSAAAASTSAANASSAALEPDPAGSDPSDRRVPIEDWLGGAGSPGAAEPYEPYGAAAAPPWYAGAPPEAGYDPAAYGPGSELVGQRTGGYASLQPGDFGYAMEPAEAAYGAAPVPGLDPPGTPGRERYPDGSYDDRAAQVSSGAAAEAALDGAETLGSDALGPAEGPAPEAALVARGKALLREGRGLARAGRELGRADGLLRGALAAFEGAAALAPDSVAVLGNWGNTLLAYGLLKKRCLVLLGAPPPDALPAEAERMAAAGAALVGEARAALVAAGQRFRAVAERDAGDARALANWGRALCLRAQLADQPEEARALYGGAVAKLEAVLEGDPRNRPVLRAAGLALADLAAVQADPGGREARQLLQDAVNYLGDALALGPEDVELAEALERCMEALRRPGR